MKRIWFLASALVVVTAMGIGGASLALFSAQAPANNNTFIAGTLAIDAQRDQGDGVPGPMYYFSTATGGAAPNQYPTGYLAPGDGQVNPETLHRVLQVENVGSLDARLVRIHTDLHPGGSKYLADKLHLKITTDPAGMDVIASGTVGSFIDADQTLSTPIEVSPGDLANLHFWVAFPLDADNSYQGLEAVVDFTVYAEQVKNNP